MMIQVSGLMIAGGRFFLPAQEIDNGLMCGIQGTDYPAVVGGNGFADEMEAAVGCGAGEGGVDV